MSTENQKKTKDTAITVALIGALTTILVTLITIFQDPLVAYFSPTPTPLVTATTIASEINVEPSITPFTSVTSSPETHKPVLIEIQTRKTGEPPNQANLADVSFRDSDGDSNLIRYELVTTSATHDVKRSDDQITIESDRQIWGAVIPIQWNCEGTGYVVIFNVYILDAAGNQSNKKSVTFDCR